MPMSELNSLAFTHSVTGQHVALLKRLKAGQQSENSERELEKESTSTILIKINQSLVVDAWYDIKF